MDAAAEYRRLVIEAGHVDQTEKAWAFSFSQATIDAAKLHPLALITSPTGDKLRFAPPESGLRMLFGFSLARANARMLINADSKRRSARNPVRASRPQSTSAVAVHG